MNRPSHGKAQRQPYGAMHEEPYTQPRIANRPPPHDQPPQSNRSAPLFGSSQRSPLYNSNVPVRAPRQPPHPPQPVSTRYEPYLSPMAYNDVQDGSFSPRDRGNVYGAGFDYPQPSTRPRARPPPQDWSYDESYEADNRQSYMPPAPPRQQRNDYGTYYPPRPRHDEYEAEMMEIHQPPIQRQQPPRLPPKPVPAPQVTATKPKEEPKPAVDFIKTKQRLLAFPEVSMLTTKANLQKIQQLSKSELVYCEVIGRAQLAYDQFNVHPSCQVFTLSDEGFTTDPLRCELWGQQDAERITSNVEYRVFGTIAWKGMVPFMKVVTCTLATSSDKKVLQVLTSQKQAQHHEI